jgi:hypothetical protein
VRCEGSWGVRKYPSVRHAIGRVRGSGIRRRPVSRIAPWEALSPKMAVSYGNCVQRNFQSLAKFGRSVLGGSGW